MAISNKFEGTVGGYLTCLKALQHYKDIAPDEF